MGTGTLVDPQTEELVREYMALNLDNEMEKDEAEQ